MGVKAGVAPERCLKWCRRRLWEGMLSRDTSEDGFSRQFDRVTFALKLARKDLGLATEVGRELNVPMPLASLVEQDFLAALARGLGEKDSPSR